MMSLSDKDDDAAAQPHLHRIAQRRKKNAQKQNKILKKENKRRKTYVPQETPRSLCFELLTCFCGGSRKKQKKKPNQTKMKKKKRISYYLRLQRERETGVLTASQLMLSTQRRKDRHLWASPSSFVFSPRVPSVGVCAASAPVRSRFFSSPWSVFIFPSS